MRHSIKTVLTYQHVSLPRSLSSNLGREASAVRFCTKSDSNSRDHNMDKSQKPSEETKHGDVMSHSFGEGYATRCDEEGFGGIYGGKQSMPKTDECIHENHPAYDKTQGSEVKEKEKARHQPSANA
ncbi:hypothetical protein LR48_Vigan06g044800 [Vigna angularis]|uniref:Uncharacterized protein n=2 Tax=Phaseolus angularis TaxID=3914 RepID=A0A0L9URD3_PHAAN|nr:uncharacterized protein LOC108335471 [Vigna angularis]KAG2376096.1 uncharacterized protein HKW66_Vig0157500 [Vigna angularis]KOM45142.1 hypothetical protein LR48_Vigan06g044800 [Vigna angularis]BAU00088.1 hypothetical protein VIGAN_10165100 [Vigna angularis var. angularis]